MCRSREWPSQLTLLVSLNNNPIFRLFSGDTAHRSGGSLVQKHHTPFPCLVVNPPPAVNWYCLHTKPLKEAQVAAYCTDQLGLETYFPRLRQQRVIRRVRKTIVGPLFPRYLFCRFDPQLYFRAVRYSPDVTGVVTAGNTPTIVADDLISGLRQWAGGDDGILTLRPKLPPGAPVEVVSGPMQGLSGIILEDSTDRDRVTLLLSILQCGAQLSVDRSEIRLIA